jgi:hypothetical protein
MTRDVLEIVVDAVIAAIAIYALVVSTLVVMSGMQ